MEKMKLNIQLFGLTTTLTASATSSTDDAAITTNQNYINLSIRVQTTKPTWNGQKGAYYQVTTTSQNNGTQTGSKYYFSIGSSTGSGDKTFNVTLGPFDHNADGTLNDVSISVYVRITDSTHTTKTASVVMGTIPRASIPTLSSSSVNMGSSVTIYTNRYSSSFTHTIRYAFGSASGTIASNVATSTSWTPPLTLAQQIPSAVSGVGTIYCDTYSGSTLVGTKTINITLNVPSSVVPSTSFTQVQEAGAVPSSWGIYVRTKSRIALAISGSGAYGSSITGYRISYYGGAVTTQSATTSYIQNAGTITFTGQVTDSRGRSASTTTSISVVDYYNPTISTAQVQRCDASGNIDNNGEYMYISYGASISSCSNKNTPSAVYKVGYRVHNTGNYTYVNLTTNANSYSASGMLFSDGIKAASASGTKVQFSTSNTYDIIFYVKDYFMEYTNLQLLDAGFDLMNFNASGKSMAIGKVSEASANEELLEIGMDTDIDGNININGNLEVNGTPTMLAGVGGDLYIGANNNSLILRPKGVGVWQGQTYFKTDGSFEQDTGTNTFTSGYDGNYYWRFETDANEFRFNKQVVGANGFYADGGNLKRIGQSITCHTEITNWTTDHTPVPINSTIKSSYADDFFTINSNNITIKDGSVHHVLVSYNVRYDWNVDTNVVYYTNISQNNNLDWATHFAIYKTNFIQYGVSFSPKVYSVSQNDYFTVDAWSQNNITTSGGTVFEFTITIID